MSLVSGTNSSLTYHSGTNLLGVNPNTDWITARDTNSINYVSQTATSFMANSIN